MIQQLTRKEIRTSVGRKCRRLKQHGRELASEAVSRPGVNPDFGTQVIETYRNMRLREVNHYARVRIVLVGPRKYGLNYDPTEPNEITGPFPSRKKAAAWFLGGGR